MHQRTGVRQTVREVRLVAPESMGALHRAPLAPPIADDDDQRRCRGPTGAAPLLLHCFVSGHLIRGMPQLEDALLFHPVDEIGIDLRVAAEEILLHLRIFNDNVFPGLRIGAGHRPAAGFENFVDVFIGNRIRF